MNIDYRQLKYEIKKLGVYNPNLDFELHDLEKLIDGLASDRYLIIDTDSLKKDLKGLKINDKTVSLNTLKFTSNFNLEISTSVDINLWQKATPEERKEILKEIRKMAEYRFIDDFRLWYGVDKL